MSDTERSAAERLDSVLARMDDRQRELFIVRGEGFVDGYKHGRADSSPVPIQPGNPAQNGS